MPQYFSLFIKIKTCLPNVNISNKDMQIILKSISMKLVTMFYGNLNIELTSLEIELLILASKVPTVWECLSMQILV